MTTELNEAIMASELSGSAFFRPAPPTQQEPEPNLVPEAEQPKTIVALSEPAKGAKPAKITDKQTPKQPMSRDTVIPRYHDTMTEEMAEHIVSSVWEIGKEAATHRFTKEEKDAIADVEYSYNRQGWRTSENEIARIGVNWLVEDYRANGENSVLHRVLKLLHRKP
jgi:hypothetical protein